MEIDQRIQSVKARFDKFKDWEDKYREIIKFGKDLEQLDEVDWIDKYKVKGCQSQVWLKPTYRNGQVTFQAASDAILVRGIIAVIVEVYSNSSPVQIMSTKPDFLKEIGITEHLSLNRTNGLASMIKQVQMYAFVFKSLYDKGVMDADNL
jgi:cysteine desulfuration protein SufE